MNQEKDFKTAYKNAYTIKTVTYKILLFKVEIHKRVHSNLYQKLFVRQKPEYSKAVL